MRTRRTSTQARTAIATLLSFVFTTCGGTAWAENRAAAKNPAQMLRRWIDEPRLALSPEEKDQLRRAAERLEATAAAPRPSKVPTVGSPRALDVGRDLGALGRELERLTTSNAGVGSQAASLDQIAVRAADLDRRALAEFAEEEKWLRTARLPSEILARHARAVADYRAAMAQVRQQLETAKDGGDAALRRAASGLAGSHAERPWQRLQADRLPFRSATPGVATRLTRRAAERARLETSSTAQLSPARAVDASDLEPTEEVQITPEIQALAASLGNRPLEIYNWVRNHIDYVPTGGSVQGSQLTLDARRGNATDTASLLIALLRAAGIPSRYVRGTVEVPSAQVVNWVGGAADLEVAQQLLGQGGVETVGLVAQGVVTHLRIEHVWVEALVNFVPGRGTAVESADTWLALDASFKQHTFRPRAAVFSDVPPPPLVQPGDQLFEVDESLGRITNVDDDVIDERLSTWVVEVDDYAFSHGLEQTLDGLLGGPSITARTLGVLPGSLPYRVVERSAATSAWPASLRHGVRISAFASEADRASGDAVVAAELSLPRLGSGRLGLTFEPATPADAAVLAAAREGGAASLPVYLVNVVPVVRLDDAELARGGSLRMGGELLLDVRLDGPASPETLSYSVIAGDEIVLGVTGNGINRQVIEKRFADHPVEAAGEYYHQVALHYWAESDYLAEISARSLGVRVARLPSVGLFSSPLSVSYLFGAPRSAVYSGRAMDVRRSLLAVAGADAVKVVAFVKQAGAASSYLEGSVFDQLENREAPSIRGISAMQLLSDAIALDVPIYRITSANAAAALPLLELPEEVEQDVQTAVSLGKSVMISEREIDTGPWKGVGYIVRDEATGAGAYLISGGANGGGLADCVPAKEPSWARGLVLVFLFILLLALLVYLLAMLGPLVEAAVLTAAEAFQSLLLFMRGLSPLITAGA